MENVFIADGYTWLDLTVGQALDLQQQFKDINKKIELYNKFEETKFNKLLICYKNPEKEEENEQVREH